MWSGYLKTDQKFMQFCKTFQLPLIEVHTSGHAYLGDLKRLVEALKPKFLFPVHTLHREEFEKHFPNVVLIDDGVGFEV